MGRTQRLAQPEDFGKYSLVARLADGRIGEVYKAKSHGVEGFEKILCIKIINPALAANERFVELLIEEAKRSVALSHANIAQVLDLGHEEQQNKYYIATELIDGLDLARAMKLAARFDHPWPQEMSVFVAAEIAKALDYAHRRKDFNFNNLNIVHRSLRPENIMLSYDGEVKITDFGISRALEAIEPIDDRDIIDRVLYAAPEVVDGHNYTRQSDIFSLGLLLYEMLAGVHPYRDDDADEVQRRAHNRQLPPIGEYADVHRQLQQILESMLAVDPAGRAQNCGQLYEELIGYLFGNSMQADNRQLALTMQELRQREQDDDAVDQEATQEVGLEEISKTEFESAFEEGGVFHDASDADNIEEQTHDALPSSHIDVPYRSRHSDAPALPGALEDLYQSVADGRGKAVLLSGRMGRGRQVLADRLVDALDYRPAATARLIHTSDDDRFRPFGVFSDLMLRSVHHTVAETDDHRRDALDILERWGISAEARRTMATLWQLEDPDLIEQSTRQSHLLEIAWRMLAALSKDGPFVLVVDRVERLDQVSLDVLRDLIASIGELPALLVLGTRAEESIREIFDAGQPRDLEAIHVSGDDPPTPEDLSDISPLADRLLTLLTLADRPLSVGPVAAMLDADAEPLQQAAEDLVERGAMRIPRPGRYRSDVPNWLTWRDNHRDADVAPMAATLSRHFVHRLSRGESDRLTPTLLRLYAIAGDRRQLLNLAAPYGDWLQQNAWQHTALDYYQHLSELLGQPRLGVPQTRVRFVLEAAELALEMALIDECRTLLEPLSALTEMTHDDAGFARSQLLVGQLAMQQDDLETARNHFQRSLETARSLNNPELLARASLALAVWCERFGDAQGALNHLGSAVNLDARHIDARTRAVLLLRASEMWANRGMVGRAGPPVEDLQQLAHNVPQPAIRCRTAIAEARLAAHDGDIDTAGTHYDRALGLANSHELAALTIELLRERTALCLRHERFQDAITWANQVVGVAERRGDYFSAQRARDLRALARCHVGDDVKGSIDQLRNSLRRATERGVPNDVFHGHDFMARALGAIGRTDDARHHRQHADELARTMRMNHRAA